MDPTITIQVASVTEHSIKIYFECTSRYAANDYIVYYECIETGEERATSTFSMEENGEYTTKTATFSGLKRDTTYTFYARLDTARSTFDKLIDDEISESTTGPSDWDWDTTIKKGGKLKTIEIDGQTKYAPLPASEWNDFIDRVFEFLEYCDEDAPKDKSEYEAQSETPMSADLINEVIELIDKMDPDGDPPEEVEPNTQIKAETFIDLKEYLNSVP